MPHLGPPRRANGGILPDEVLASIFGLLPEGVVLFVVPMVCRHWRDVCGAACVGLVRCTWAYETTRGRDGVAGSNGAVLAPIFGRARCARQIDVGGALHSAPGALDVVLTSLASAATTVIVLGAHAALSTGVAAAAAREIPARCPNLEELQIPVAGGAPLAGIAKLSGLRSLCLIGAPGPGLSDPDFGPVVRGLRRLRELAFKGFPRLTGLFAPDVPTGVVRLLFRGCGITCLAGLRAPRLVSLAVQNQAVTRALVVGMAGHPGVVGTFSMKRTRIDGAGAPPPAGPAAARSGARTLKLGRTEWDDDGTLTALIGACASAEVVDLNNAVLRPGHFASLCDRGRGIRELHLLGVDLPAADVRGLGQLVSLEVLRLDTLPYAPGPDDPGTGRRQETLDVLPPRIGRLAVLRTPWIRPGQVGGIFALRGLTELSLDGCTGLTDQGLSQIARRTPGMVVVNICRCGLTAGCLETSVRLWGKLEVLFLSRAAVGSGSGLRHLRGLPVGSIHVRTKGVLEASRLEPLAHQASLRELVLRVGSLTDAAGADVGRAGAQALFGGRVAVDYRRPKNDGAEP